MCERAHYRAVQKRRDVGPTPRVEIVLSQAKEKIDLPIPAPAAKSKIRACNATKRKVARERVTTLKIPQNVAVSQRNCAGELDFVVFGHFRPSSRLSRFYKARQARVEFSTERAADVGGKLLLLDGIGGM